MTSDETRPDRDALRETLEAIIARGLADLCGEVRDRPVHQAYLDDLRETFDKAWAVVEPALTELKGEVADKSRVGHAVAAAWEARYNEAQAALTQRDAEIKRLRNAGYDHYGWQDRARKAETALAEARRVIAAVEALCDEAIEANRPPNATNSEVVWLVEDIRVALAGDQPSP